MLGGVYDGREDVGEDAAGVGVVVECGLYDAGDQRKAVLGVG